MKYLMYALKFSIRFSDKLILLQRQNDMNSTVLRTNGTDFNLANVHWPRAILVLSDHAVHIKAISTSVGFVK